MEDFVRFIGEGLIATQELYLRGAKGEPIDELADFDKRLALLKRRIETQEEATSNERSPEAVLRLYDGLVRPLMGLLVPRMEQISKFFYREQHSVSVNSKGSSTIVLDTGSLALQVEGLESVLREHANVYEVTIHQRWNSFTAHPDKNLTFILALSLGADQFGLSLVSSQDLPLGTLIEGGYGFIPSQEDVLEIAKKVLEGLSKLLESWSGMKASDTAAMK